MQYHLCICNILQAGCQLGQQRTVHTTHTAHNIISPNSGIHGLPPRLLRLPHALPPPCPPPLPDHHPPPRPPPPPQQALRDKQQSWGRQGRTSAKGEAGGVAAEIYPHVSGCVGGVWPVPNGDCGRPGGARGAAEEGEDVGERLYRRFVVRCCCC